MTPAYMSDPLRDALATSLGANFRLDRELGGAGMSRVFVAHDTALQRDIVVKVLAPDLALELSAERFRLEIATAARLQHPNIVPVLSAGEANDLPWYTMPFVAGESLRLRLERGSVALGEAVSILRDVARALAAAHEAGVVHRDIKPENVLLSRDAAVVTDFGIAKALRVARTQPEAAVPRSGTQLTTAGTSLGTPAYMAPEQVAGDADVDARTDLYAWGLVAYETLSGTHALGAHTSRQQWMTAQLRDLPRPLEEHVPSLPPAIARVVMQCLEKDPTSRPASARDVLAALDALSSSPGHAMAGARTRLGARAAILLAIVLAGVLGAGIVWRARTNTADAGPPLVAVADFASTGDGDSLFAAGLADAVSGRLASVPTIRVVDRGSVRSIRDARDARSVGRALGASYVLRASLQWARGADGRRQVRVLAALVRVSDGIVRWSGEPMIVTPDDPFAVQATMATNVAIALDVALAARDSASLATPPTHNLEAYGAYLRGQQLTRRSNATMDRTLTERALVEYEDAVRRDPRFADAIAAAASARYDLSVVRLTSRATLDTILSLTDSALAISPDQVEALVVRARLLTRRGGTIRASLDTLIRAARRRPSSALLHASIVDYASLVADTAVIRASTREAISLAPRNVDVLAVVASGAFGINDIDLADSLVKVMEVLNPGSADLLRYQLQIAYQRGDTAAMGQLYARLERVSGPLDPTLWYLYRHGTMSMRRILDTMTIPALPGQRGERLRAALLGEQVKSALGQGRMTDARMLADSLDRLARMWMAAGEPGARFALAWTSALRGDRRTALAALDTVGARELFAGEPASRSPSAGFHCAKSEVFGLLGLVDSLLPALRKCVTYAWSTPAWAIAREPALAQVRQHPRVVALLDELWSERKSVLRP